MGKNKKKQRKSTSQQIHKTQQGNKMCGAKFIIENPYDHKLLTSQTRGNAMAM